MKKVNIKSIKQTTINLEDVKESTPIFCKDIKTGRLEGMVLKTNNSWFISVGGDYGAVGNYPTREALLVKGSTFYDYFVEED